MVSDFQNSTEAFQGIHGISSKTISPALNYEPLPLPRATIHFHWTYLTLIYREHETQIAFLTMIRFLRVRHYIGRPDHAYFTNSTIFSKQHQLGVAFHGKNSSFGTTSKRQTEPSSRGSTKNDHVGRNPAHTSVAIPWSQLTAWEKVKRSGQNTQDLLVILSGLGIALGVVYFMYSEVFKRDSKWSWFSDANERIKNDSLCRRLLGEPITAHGDVGRGGGWGIRDRGIRSREEVDKIGTAHLYLTFQVEGKHTDGQVYVHVQKRPSATDYSYVTLSLQVKGRPTIYLEGGDSVFSNSGGMASEGKGWLGVRWSW